MRNECKKQFQCLSAIFLPHCIKGRNVLPGKLNVVLPKHSALGKMMKKI